MECRGGKKEKGVGFSSPVVGSGPLMGQALIPSRRDPERNRPEAKEEEEEAGGGHRTSPFGERKSVVKLLSEGGLFDRDDRGVSNCLSIKMTITFVFFSFEIGAGVESIFSPDPSDQG